MNQQHALLYTVVGRPSFSALIQRLLCTRAAITCSSHCKWAKHIPERGGFPVEKESPDCLRSRHSQGGKHCAFPAFSYEVSITPEDADILKPPSLYEETKVHWLLHGHEAAWSWQNVPRSVWICGSRGSQATWGATAFSGPWVVATQSARSF